MGWMDSFLNSSEASRYDTRDSLADLAHDVGTSAISRGDETTSTTASDLEHSLRDND